MTTPIPQQTVHVAGLALVAWLAFFIGSAPAGASIPEGDEAWEQRAEVSDAEGRADPETVWRAADFYREAISVNPRNLEARWKLLRAFHFEAAFSSVSPDQQRAALERGVEVSDVALQWLARRAGGEGLDIADETVAIRKLYPATLREDAARIHFYSALIWERWSEMNGRMEAVKRGLIGRLHGHTQIVVAIHPELEAGGGYRLYARLHAETPRVPFVTGWAKRGQAIVNAERALKVSPEDPENRLLYAELRIDLEAGPSAEAILDEAEAEAPQRAAVAPPLEELRALADLEARPNQLAEDLAVRRSARERLGMVESRATEVVPAAPGEPAASKPPTAPTGETPAEVF